MGENSFAQNKKLDSLLTQLPSAKKDTSKVKAVLEIASLTEDTAQRHRYLKLASALSREIHYKKGEAQSYIGIARYYMFTNIDYSKGTFYCTKALSIYTELEDLEGVATSLQHLGVINSALNDFKSAAVYYRKAIAVSLKSKNENHLRMHYNMLGSTFMKQNVFDSALYFYKKAEAIAIKGKMATHVLYVNIASCYLQMEKIDSSWKYIHLTDSSYKARNMKYGVHWVNLLSGHASLLEHNFKKAINFLEPPVEHALNKKDDELFANSAPNLVEAYEADGQYKKAYLLKDKLTKFNDSISGVDKISSVKAIENKYELDEKEKITKLTNEKKEAEYRAEMNHQKMIVWSSSIALVFTIVLGAFIFRAFRQKQKVNLIISKQKALVEEKQREILDSIHYAKRIQQSLLPTEMYIDKSINRLKK